MRNTRFRLLTRLYRVGFEPTGKRRKVSVFHSPMSHFLLPRAWLGVLITRRSRGDLSPMTRVESIQVAGMILRESYDTDPHARLGLAEDDEGSGPGVDGNGQYFKLKSSNLYKPLVR